jgi:hypothetical protein
MTLRSFMLIAIAVGAVALAACTGSNSGTGGAGGTGSTGASSNVSSASSGTGGSSSCTPTCAEAIVNGGEPCSSDTTAASDYAALSSCVKTNCASKCSTFISGHTALDAACDGCAETSCASQSMACANN